jgi:hypothetical protein
MKTRRLECRELDPVESVQDFVKRISEIKSVHTPVTWYRGHSDQTYRLVPTIGRSLKYNRKKLTCSLEQERLLLHRFRRRVYPLVGRIMNEWEAMFLARHYELPTRILDWTRLPLVGLYFACSKNQDRDADVWAMVRFDDGEHDLDVLRVAMDEGKTSPLTFFEPRSNANDVRGRTDDAVKIIHPVYNSPRIVSQDGVFTLHSDPSRPLDDYAGALFDDDRLDVSHLLRIRIPYQAKPAIIIDLDTLGINRRTIFPDLDGIARHLWEVETMWRGEPDR